MSTPGIDASFQTLGEIVDDLDQGFQGYFFPGLVQGFHIRVRLLARFFFEDRPHEVVERVQIWAIGRPFTSGVSLLKLERLQIQVFFQGSSCACFRHIQLLSQFSGCGVSLDHFFSFGFLQFSFDLFPSGLHCFQFLYIV